MAATAQAHARKRLGSVIYLKSEVAKEMSGETMPDSTFVAQYRVISDDAALPQALSELAATLALMGISGEAGPAAGLESASELVQTASKVLRGLTRQLNSAQIQRNLLATHAEDWFWQWDMVSGTIRIETPPSLRGPKKRHETSSWGSLIDADEIGTLQSINGFSASGHDHLQLRARMRGDSGDWRDIDWQGRIAARDKAGIGTFAAGTLKLLRAETQSASQEIAQDEKRAKLDFLANISHEIRTPMTAILGASFLAMEIDDPFQQKELARTIKASAESLVELLDDALDFTKLEAGMVVLESTEFDFRTLMTETAKIYGLAAQRKGLDFIFRMAADLPVRLLSDPVRIRQIVANLLGNAVKFTNEGEIALTVNGRPVSDNAGQWTIEISIRDTGIGIPSDKQSAIFDMFTQADASTTRRFGGTGIGLSICRQLASLLGGEIRVDSRPGQGSVFCLDIKVSSAPCREITKRPSSLSGQRILILERNPAQRHVLSEMLASLGVNPVVCEALSELASLGQPAGNCASPPLLALIDPEFAGIKAIAMARQWESLLGLSESRIIFMRNIAATLWNTGFQHDAESPTLLKPFSIDDLQAVINLACSRLGGQPDVLLDSDIAPTAGKDSPPIRVLLAEDNPTSREIIAAMLRRAGYQVDAVSNGAEAVEAYQLEPFAFGIILMDIQMPVMDGFAAAEGIRACEERRSWVSTGNWRSTPIVAMTADALKNIDIRCRDAGMNGVLIKPSSPEVLFAMIERTIAESESTSQQNACHLPLQQSHGRAPRDNISGKRPEALDELVKRLDRTLLDLDVPLEWVGKDPTALRRLIDSFLEEVSNSMQEVDERLAAGQLMEASSLLHRMKSSLKILGAGDACRHTETLYEACNTKDYARAELSRVSLGQSMKHLIQMLDVVCATL